MYERIQMFSCLAGRSLLERRNTKPKVDGLLRKARTMLLRSVTRRVHEPAAAFGLRRGPVHVDDIRALFASSFLGDLGLPVTLAAVNETDDSIEVYVQIAKGHALRHVLGTRGLDKKSEYQVDRTGVLSLNFGGLDSAADGIALVIYEAMPMPPTGDGAAEFDYEQLFEIIKAAIVVVGIVLLVAGLCYVAVGLLLLLGALLALFILDEIATEGATFRALSRALGRLIRRILGDEEEGEQSAIFADVRPSPSERHVDFIVREATIARALL